MDLLIRHLRLIGLKEDSNRKVIKKVLTSRNISYLLDLSWRSISRELPKSRFFARLKDRNNVSNNLQILRHIVPCNLPDPLDPSDITNRFCHSIGYEMLPILTGEHLFSYNSSGIDFTLVHRRTLDLNSYLLEQPKNEWVVGIRNIKIRDH